MKPSFPLKVIFKEDDDQWILENEIEAAQNLEWFNSDDPDEKATVIDKLGKHVRLVVKDLEVLICEIAEEKGQ